MTILAELSTIVNERDAQRVTLQSHSHGVFLVVEELPHRPEGTSDMWQPRAMIRLSDAIEATRAMVEAVRLLDPEELGDDEPIYWDDGALGREEIGFDWDAYCDWRARQLEDMADALAAKRGAYFATWTKFELDSAKAAGGETYNIAKVSSAGVITDADQLRAVTEIRRQYREFVSGAPVEAAEYETTPPAGGGGYDDDDTPF